MRISLSIAQTALSGDTCISISTIQACAFISVFFLVQLYSEDNAVYREIMADKI